MDPFNLIPKDIDFFRQVLNKLKVIDKEEKT
jgi:hypothetical protein